MSRPSWNCHPSLRTQPKVPVVQGLPEVPTKNFSSPPFSNRAWLAVGSWKGWAFATGRSRLMAQVKLQTPNSQLQGSTKLKAPGPALHGHVGEVRAELELCAPPA